MAEHETSARKRALKSRLTGCKSSTGDTRIAFLTSSLSCAYFESFQGRVYLQSMLVTYKSYLLFLEISGEMHVPEHPEYGLSWSWL